ncbi:MAG: hypothetical protein IPH35_15340 [Rhodoferax sp.]|nr:hypothetical protein [Rhodoferax sp.]
MDEKPLSDFLMSEKQLGEFLAEVRAELKARQRAYSKAMRKETKLLESQGKTLIASHGTFQNMDLDPVAIAAISLSELLRAKFATNADDRHYLHEAVTSAFCLGRKSEILNNEYEHTRRASKATNGRRLIGATSRAKVAKAAESFKHLSKEKAAASMAGVVNLDSGTIRRYLSEIYPGDKWKH